MKTRLSNLRRLPIFRLFYKSIFGFRHFMVFFRQTLFSTLTRQIVFLNLVGLVALLLGFLYLNQFRAGLIDARIQSLITQGEIIASAIANTATLDTDTLHIDPNRLWELESGESSSIPEDFMSSLEFSINPEQVAPVLRKLVSPTRIRARVYDRDGYLLIDSQALFSFGDIQRTELPPPETHASTWFQKLGRWYRGSFKSTTTPLMEIGPAIGNNLIEVQKSLQGQRINAVRINQKGDTIVSVAVPIQRVKMIRGVLLLSTQGGDIDGIIAAERLALLRIFMVAAFVMIVLSLALARSIVIPVRKLSEAAERVRSGSKSANAIPDFSGRSDEIGHLSGTLREMTLALFNRIEAIERFAADVAHELKNPLTSVRSAVETLPLAKTEDARNRLLSIIQHDVKRMDRLITDISDASRLDAELARVDAHLIDVEQLVRAVVTIFNDRRTEADAIIEMVIENAKKDHSKAPFAIMGHDSRLAQVLNNLLDNARSFSPPDKPITITLRKKQGSIEITVDDCGPGIPDHVLGKVFERFYTDRPDQGFGQNSGLGLAISKQIIEAHRGTITAENRYPENNELSDNQTETAHLPLGARFIISLPQKSKH